MLNKNFNIQELITKPFDRSNYILFLKTLFEISPKSQKLEVSNTYEEYIKEAEYLNYYESNREKIHFYSVSLENKDVERARVFQRDFIAKQLENEGEETALVVFYTEDKWRLSLIKIDYFEEGEKIKKRRRTAKRFSFFVGKGEINNTCKQRIKTLFNKEKVSIKDIEEAFSVEKVTKEFFEKYTKLYSDLYNEVKRLRESDSLINEEFKEKHISEEDFAKKILGQIVFLYFLQKKGWLGIKRDPLTKKFGKFGEGDRNFMHNLFKISKKRGKNFFNDYLEKLFYDALAKSDRKIEDYAFELDGNEWKIPFLNGGLFEPIGEYDWKRTDINIDDNIFENIFKTFDMYNFTVREDEPMEKEVAIDPEMLGKVFENLLETKERKSTGAFYTPREIVHYMCQQSLINYLETNTNIDREILERFVTKDCSLNLPEEIKENIYRINNLLRDIKVVDPAVGSGAFLVGMMTEIVKARSYLTNKNTYDLKGECIENNLHGVDISPGAVDICQLRLWLSLVVDEENYGDVKPLPNLDYKIMCGNSLIEDYKEMKLWDDKWLGIKEKKVDKKKELKIIEDKIRGLKSEMPFLINKKDEKKDIEKKIRKLEKEKKVLMKSKGENMKLSYSDSERKLKNLKALHKKFTHISDKFEKQEEKKKIEKATIELIKAKLKEEGNQETFKELEEIIQKKRSMPFFLWKMNFIEIFDRENPGFDVVIANPPYIKEYTNKKAFEGLKNSPYYQGKMDLWYLFGCLSLDLLKKGGVECFIAPNNWRTNFGASILRKNIIERTKILEFIDFGDYKIFTAGIQTMVYLLKKDSDNNHYSLSYSKLKKKDIETNQLTRFLYSKKENDFYDKYKVLINKNDFEGWKTISFLKKNVQKIIEKISTQGNFYLQNDNLAQGIVAPQENLNKSNSKKLFDKYKIGTGIFVINEEELKGLNLSKKEIEIIKPYYTTENISKYLFDKNNFQWIIYTKSDINKKIKNYPKIKEHLDKFKEIITSDNKPYGLHRARNEKFFKGEKIISVRKCKKPSFCYTLNDAYISQTFYVIKSEEINLKYLISILNSELISFWLYKKGKLQGELYQIDSEPLKEIPIKKIPFLDQEPFIEKVDKILNITKDEDYLKNQDKQSRVRELEKKIDKMVYELYELTPEEIKIVEGFGK